MLYSFKVQVEVFFLCQNPDLWILLGFTFVDIVSLKVNFVVVQIVGPLSLAVEI
jgi:hypothetical protein